MRYKVGTFKYESTRKMKLNVDVIFLKQLFFRNSSPGQFVDPKNPGPRKT